MKRASGVLMHISSLPGPDGIGTFGQSAYDFVDFLEAAKQSYWQILPLTTTSYGDSPYQSFSAFAGNTNFIDFTLLAEEGLLKETDFKDVNFGNDPEMVNYSRIFDVRRPILEQAVKNFLAQNDLKDFNDFVKDAEDWLVPFSEYMAIKESFGLAPWYEWDEKAIERDETTLNNYRTSLAAEITYHQVTQFFFTQQYTDLKQYANDKGIQIIGDIPIYVARDSVEMWETPEFFKMQNKVEPAFVSGTPPDGFSDEGQYWGNPIYDWEYMQERGYDWWIWRLEESFKLYDVVRIDHFRGFESFWQVPYGAPTPASGKWVKGPGYDLFKYINDALGDVNIIAEDLGFLTQDVIDMLEKTGYPGMKVLQFGFNGHDDSIELPHNYTFNSVAYVGTHDNMTARGWYEDEATLTARDQMDRYLHRRYGEKPSEALNRGIASSVSNLVIYTMQDLLDLDNTARMNEPSTIGGNWQWRMNENAITDDLIERLARLTVTYFRDPEAAEIEIDQSLNENITE